MDQVDQFLDTIFIMYDKDESGVLEKAEARNFMNDLWEKCGESVTPEERELVENAIDNNGDDKLTKDELRVLIQAVLSASG